MKKNTPCHGNDPQRPRRAALVFAFLFAFVVSAVAEERPNFLVIIAEDMSPNLGCYSDPDARTPNLDTFAASGIRFDRAYSAAGVCAISRSAMITAMHASSIGTQHMRSQIKLPPEIRPFPAYLRDAGYYCVNRGKEDFNFRTPPGVWDKPRGKGPAWSGRAPGQPFLAILHFPDTHESRLWPQSRTRRVDETKLRADQRHDPASVSPPGWIPKDDPAVRREWARYQDLISLMDDQYIGPLLKDLQQSGLADDTIVFFFSDHGAPFPNAKQWVTEAGTRVPLLVRVPEKWQHLVKEEPGTATDRLVSLMDLGPTLLSLAGTPIPGYMEGQAFLGPAAAPPRRTMVFTRDRMDERVDFIRAVRDGRYRYVRNFLPRIPPFPWLTYMEKLETSRAFRRLQAEGKPGPFTDFLASTKPSESLYDLENDPNEIVNLAADPAHRETLLRMRDALRSWMLATRDSGFLPEQLLMDAEADAGTIRDFASQANRYPLERLIDGEVSHEDLRPVVRYWAAIASGDVGALRKKLATETVPDVRIALAWTLALRDAESQDAIAALVAVAEEGPARSRLLALNVLDYLGDRAEPARPLLERILTEKETGANRNDQWLAAHVLANLAAAKNGSAAAASRTTAGFAKIDITPRVPVRMVGYASRDYEGQPAEGKLWARALALGNRSGELSAVVITMDLIGVNGLLADRVAGRLTTRLGLSREKLALCATHTHGGPALTGFLQETHFCKPVSPEQKSHIDTYTSWLVQQLEKVAAEAVQARRPAILRWGQGAAGFAMNRRVIRDGKWACMRPNPEGLVDHSVPVLIATSPAGETKSGKVLGVFLSYACHCTSYAPPHPDFHAAWAGAAASTIEQRHSGCIALVAAGCGADSNPNPRTAGAAPFIARHGVELANQVDQLLAKPDSTIQLVAPPLCELRPVELPLAGKPDRAEFVRWTKHTNQRRAFYGKLWLARLDRGKTVPDRFDYPIQLWRFPAADERVVSAVFLPGEVTSGYSLRIKREFDSPERNHWVIGYANASPCYITTAREIAEGGYEADASMISYDKTAPLKPEVEEIIIKTVGGLTNATPNQ